MGLQVFPWHGRNPFGHYSWVSLAAICRFLFLEAINMDVCWAPPNFPMSHQEEISHWHCKQVMNWHIVGASWCQKLLRIERDFKSLETAVDICGFDLSFCSKTTQKRSLCICCLHFFISRFPQIIPASGQSPLLTEIAVVKVSGRPWISEWWSVLCVAFNTVDHAFQLEVFFSGSHETSFMAPFGLTSHTFLFSFTDFSAFDGLCFSA